MKNIYTMFSMLMIMMLISITSVHALATIVYDQNSPNYDTNLGYAYDFNCVDDTCEKVAMYLYWNGINNKSGILYSNDSGNTWNTYVTEEITETSFSNYGYHIQVDENNNFVWKDVFSPSENTIYYRFNTTDNSVTTITNFSGRQDWVTVARKGTNGTLYSYSNSGSDILRTDDYGLNWVTQYTAFSYGAVNSAECNEDNCQYQLVGTNANKILVSNDYAVSWNEFNMSYNIYEVDVSPSGQYMIAGSYNSPNLSIFLSNDYGVSWSEIELNFTDADAYGVSITDTGFIAINGQDDTNSQLHFIYSNDYGNTWSSDTFNDFESMFASMYVSETGKTFFAGANYSGLGGYEINVLKAEIPTPTTSICGEYTTSNSVISFTQDENFNVGTTGVESLGGTSNTGAFGTSYYTCMRIMNADNVTIEGNGYSLIGNNESSFPYDLGIYVSNVTNLQINNLKFNDMYYGLIGVEENYGGLGRNCYNENISTNNIEYNNIKAVGLKLGCNVNTLGVLDSKGLYAYNTSVYDSNNAVGIGFFDYRNFNDVYFDKVYFDNAYLTSGVRYKFYWNNMNNFVVNDMTEIDSNMISFRINNASNGVISNINSVNSGFRFLPSAGSSNLLLENVSVDNIVFPSGTTLGNQYILYIGSAGLGLNTVNINNVYFNNININASLIHSSSTLTSNNDYVYYKNITVENSIFYSAGGSGYPMFRTGTKNTYINIDGFVTRNVTVSSSIFELEGVNLVFKGLDLDWNYVSSGHKLSTALCLSCISQGSFATLQLSDSIIRTPSNYNNQDQTQFAEWFVSEVYQPLGNPIVTMNNVTAFIDYKINNRSYTVDTFDKDVTPFHITDYGSEKLRFFGLPQNNKGWFPKTLTNATYEYDNITYYGYYNTTESELYSGNYETSWDDIALWNGTTGYTLDYSVVPNILTSNVSYANYFYTEYIPPCVEDWVANDTACNGVNYTIQYYDANSCGTYDNLPIDNGTVVSCSSPPIGLNAYQQQATEYTNNYVLPLLFIMIILGIVGGFLVTFVFKDDPKIQKTVAMIIGVVVLIMIIGYIIILNTI